MSSSRQDKSSKWGSAGESKFTSSQQINDASTNVSERIGNLETKVKELQVATEKYHSAEKLALTAVDTARRVENAVYVGFFVLMVFFLGLAVETYLFVNNRDSLSQEVVRLSSEQAKTGFELETLKKCFSSGGWNSCLTD